MLGKATRTVNKHYWAPTMCRGLPRWLSGKETSCQCKEMQEMRVQSLGQEDSPGGGTGNSLQYSCLENPMNRGAWQTTVHGVAKSDMTA